MSQQLGPYLKLFNLEPGASFQQVTARYYGLIERFEQDGWSEARQAERARLEHAFRILKSAYTTSKAPLARVERRRSPGRSISAPFLLLTTAVVVSGIFLTTYRSEIKVRLSNYDVGDVVRWKTSSEPYGKIMQFERRHSFASGKPSPAYEIRLEGQTETLWVGERVVEKGMVPVSAD